MDTSLLHSIWTIVVLVLFIGIVIWAWSGKRKARFDEAANIRWARRMEQAGIHVTYGVVGLKTHSKVILVVRKDYNGLRRYAHIGTGNYHAGTARLYSDLGMLTCDEAIGQDLTELFNYLTGYSPPPTYRKILTAPYTLKQSLLSKIEREIKCHTPASPSHIQFKMNALEDADITRALYRAAQAGVKIDLIVRDTCRLRPGIPGLSDNVTVISVTGRFLEHSRIYYFHNCGDEEYYIGSADLMKRNLESRVEVVAPVLDPKLRQELRLILDAQLSSRRNVWEMQPDGSYLERQGVDRRGPLLVLPGVAFGAHLWWGEAGFRFRVTQQRGIIGVELAIKRKDLARQSRGGGQEGQEAEQQGYSSQHVSLLVTQARCS
mgnify:CR=1 FL=1